MAQGFGTRAIAERLNVSVKTVEFHRAELMNRLEIHDVPGLVASRFAPASFPPRPDHARRSGGRRFTASVFPAQGSPSCPLSGIFRAGKDLRKWLGLTCVAHDFVTMPRSRVIPPSTRATIRQRTSCSLSA